MTPLATPMRALQEGGAVGPVLCAERRELANGLRVVLAEKHTVPLVWLSWVTRGGVEWDPPALPGLAAMTPLLLREGTATREAGQITCLLDDLGAELLGGCDWDSAFLNLALLADDFAAGAELLLDMACAPRFPGPAVARVRQRRLAELERRRRQAGALADEAFARALYGDSPYGRSPFGTPEGLARLAASDLAAFHDAHYRPATSCMVLAGSFDSAEAVALLGSFAVPRAPLASQPAPAIAPAAAPMPGVRLLDLPWAAQTELRMGHAGVARGHPDMPGLEVLNAVLGEGPSSRLAASLRQRQGLTYHIGSRFAARHGGGPFVVATSVATAGAGAALAGIRREIERLHAEPVPRAELEQARRRLLGAELRGLQSIVGTGGTLNWAALEGDPAADLEHRRQGIAAVEPEDLLELARRHLHPERLVAVVAGPAAVLRAQLADGGMPAAVAERIETVGGMA